GALFGVGGGTVVVPLLILTAGFEVRPATGTSLAAIALISAVGAVTYSLHGEMKVGAAAVVGLPAVAGVIVGTSLQQRLATRTLTLACLCFATVTRDDELWIPLVDEPIGTFVSEIQSEQADIASAVESPRRLLAFRTFAYLRVGMLLGRLLIERDIDVDGDKSPSWAEVLLAEPDVREQATAAIRAV